jgi:NhaP-type Na+/H+ or K+/H+ antiporter
MDQTIYLVTLVGTGLFVAAAFSSMIAFRFGAPLLLLFLGIGLATGTDGLGIDFDNAGVAYFVGSIALAVILFDSGFGTSMSVLRQAAWPAVSLATVGVVVTAAIFGTATYYLTRRWTGWNPSCSAPPSPRPTRPRCSSSCAPATCTCASACARRWKSSREATIRSPSS